MDKTNEKRLQLAFASAYDYVQKAIPENRAVEVKGKDFIAWGTDNKYPEFLYSLFRDSATLQSIINGTTDFVCGNSVEGNNPNRNMTIEDMVGKLASDFLIYGCAYINVIRNMTGKVVEAYWIDARKIRTNEDNTVFFVSKDWSKSYGRVKTIVLPKYTPESDAPSSIIMLKTTTSRDTYPIPFWNGAIREATIEVEIGKYHLSEICNNFNGSAIINFNNGIPEDEQKDEIERAVNDKFTGSENAGRFILSFNDNKDSQTTIARLATDNYADRYNTLEKSVRQKMFTSFRANPNLFGIPTENLGFSSEEYDSAFKLYNRTVVKPIQSAILRAFESVGWVVSIAPFSIENNVQ